MIYNENNKQTYLNKKLSTIITIIILIQFLNMLRKKRVISSIELKRFYIELRMMQRGVITKVYQYSHHQLVEDLLSFIRRWDLKIHLMHIHSMDLHLLQLQFLM